MDRRQQLRRIADRLETYIMRRENGSTADRRNALLEMPKALREMSVDPELGVTDQPKITIEVQGGLTSKKETSNVKEER